MTCCAASLTLRHRGSFGAAAVTEGYFTAAAGPAGTALNGSQPLEAANSPLYLAETGSPATAALPRDKQFRAARGEGT